MFFLWAGLVLYAVFLAPGESGNSDEIMMQLITGSFENVDPLVVMVFSFLGVFPILFALLLLPNDRNKLPVWPFVIGSFALGAFALLPYFFLKRKTSADKQRISLKVKRMQDSKVLLGFLITLTVFLYIYGISLGSLENYQKALLSSQLVSVMTVDGIVLTWLSWYVFKQDSPNTSFLAISFIPVLGPLLLLIMRSKRKAKSA